MASFEHKAGSGGPEGNYSEVTKADGTKKDTTQGGGQ